MGVKSLWSLLSPVGRPIMLEAMEGKSLAIDSSIWIYQFQATMRDKDGHALINAHVLGFLRRISKLLFYGIKPVFVFDGGAPTLKRSTLNERKKKKAGAAASHARIAEKLLAAQMRREALNHAGGAQGSTKGKGKKSSAELDDNTVYLEDIDGSVPKTPSRRIAPTPSSSSTKKKDRAHELDRYYLPEVDLEEAVAKATRTAVPDPRLATEDELRAFIEDMRPEDFDVNSPAFRELPTEVQYEIVGDLRLKSRQTSYARLQKMLKSAPTPLDFSKQQIKNLRQRNALTQQLLMTTDSIGSAHISIPVRIASERNKEYVLIKNEGHSGGWILGIRDSGTREKPIEIDHENDKGNDKDDNSDAEMEEVEIPAPPHADPDLRSYQREMALSGLANRQTSTGLAPLSTKSSINRKTKSLPLFEPEEDESLPHSEIDDDNEELAFAIQASMDGRSTTVQPSKMAPIAKPREVSPDDDDIYASPRRLDTVLSIANAGPSRIQASPSQKRKSVPTAFGKPTLLAPTSSALNISDSDDDWEEVVPQYKVAAALVRSSSVEIESISASNDFGVAATEVSESTTFQKLTVAMSEEKIDSDEEVDDDEVNLLPIRSPEHVNELYKTPAIITDSVMDTDTAITFIVRNQQLTRPHTPSPPPHYDGFEEAEAFFAPSRSPSPSEHIPDDSKIESWDAAQEMDPHAEEGEFAKFMSHVKGKDLDDVRREIDVEIETLHQQRKAAMRDSEDITQQMITQIMTMLRLFGIPYITAPMEAEAQCAELVSLKLVDGIITDDSDVFLFGGQRVYKNMFNQSKTVEGFALADLTRDLGLDQDALIRLAYLLGSDYVEGLPGVGPVVAMELLQEFPGKDGLYKFKDWWTKVQAGKDKGGDNKSKFRKSFKKKFKDLYLPGDWPNSAVQDAYYHPIVDSSEEPFKWGLPDLDALRDFLNQELGWGKAKVDENLLPIIQKMNKRSQAMALNKQGNLNAFLDVSAGSGTRAPRQRQAYASKRLQRVLTDFRESQKAGSTASSEKSRSRSGSESEQGSGPEKKRRKTAPAATSSAKGRTKRSGKVAGQKRAGSSSKGKKRTKGKEDALSDEDAFVGSGGDPDVVDIEVPLAVKLRPRPKPRPIRKVAKTSEPSPDGSEGEV